MKRFLIIIFCMTAVIASRAQELYIDQCFSDHILAKKSVTAVKVKGERLKQYNLSSFRSITVAADKKLATWVQKQVVHDAQLATDREEGIKSGQLQYGFYVFRNKNKRTFRYIFFRNNKPDDADVTDVTMVYMEGKATLSELKQMFK
ncbi:MAG: DUF6108 family protein [Muribaculaceae bacterium]